MNLTTPRSNIDYNEIMQQNQIWKRYDLDNCKKRLNSNGYFEVAYPEHPYSVDGHMLFHRLVMEDHLQRYLDPDEIIHHVNELKTCNEVYNLFLVSAEEHTAIHRLGKQHKPKARASMSRAHQKIVQTRTRGAGGRFVKGMDI